MIFGFHLAPGPRRDGLVVSREQHAGAFAQRSCSRRLRPRLLADGLTFVAVDIVGDRILELNVFTPGGLHAIAELYGMDAASVVIADLERRIRLRAAYRTTFDPEAADVV